MIQTLAAGISILLACCFYAAAERMLIVPANAPKPVGPYSPGILAGDYLYVSGQGVRDANGAMPDGITAQTRQCLENVKSIIEAAGLTMAHVVHIQLYLEKVSDFEAVERVYTTYFPHSPPARIVIGVAKMPTDTTVEITAVAVRDLKLKKVLALKSLKPIGQASPAIAVGNRVYLSGVYGKTVTEADRNLQKALDEARPGGYLVVFRNEYATSAPAVIPVNQLPGQMRAAISVIAVSKPAGAGRPKGSNSICAADGGTIFCSAQSGTGAGEKSVQGQVQVVMKKLQAALAERGANLSHVTASNVYLDDIKDFRLMNEAYGSFFSNFPPTRTTVQSFPPANRGQGDPALVRVSVIAVKE